MAVSFACSIVYRFKWTSSWSIFCRNISFNFLFSFSWSLKLIFCIIWGILSWCTLDLCQLYLFDFLICWYHSWSIFFGQVSFAFFIKSFNLLIHIYPCITIIQRSNIQIYTLPFAIRVINYTLSNITNTKKLCCIVLILLSVCVQMVLNVTTLFVD